MLKIIKEYKFKLNGSECHFVEGDRIKVKANSEIYEGTLTTVDAFGEYFNLDVGDECIKIWCEDVTDLIPV